MRISTVNARVLIRFHNSRSSFCAVFNAPVFRSGTIMMGACKQKRFSKIGKPLFISVVKLISEKCDCFFYRTCLVFTQNFDDLSYLLARLVFFRNEIFISAHACEVVLIDIYHSLIL